MIIQNFYCVFGGDVRRTEGVGEQRYYPFGETRLTTGTIFTDQLFTGQREMTGLGIYHYNARFYSPKLGRFLSADTIVPNPANPQDFNRFSYVRNNPLRYTDPTGHKCVSAGPGDCLNDDEKPINGTGGGTGSNGGDDDIDQNPNSLPRTPKAVVNPPLLPFPPGAACNEVYSCSVLTPGVCPSGQTCLMVPNYWDLDPTHADYYTTTVTGLNITFQVTNDRYGQSFWVIGGSTSPLGVSHVAGSIGNPFGDSIPSFVDTAEFSTGLSINLSASVVLGVGVTGSLGVWIKNGSSSDLKPYSWEGGWYLTQPVVLSLTGTVGVKIP